MPVAAGYNFGLLLRWLEKFLRALITALSSDRKTAPSQFFTDDSLEYRKNRQNVKAAPAAWKGHQ